MRVGHPYLATVYFGCRVAVDGVNVVMIPLSTRREETHHHFTSHLNCAPKYVTISRKIGLCDVGHLLTRKYYKWISNGPSY